jgi:hypothetical protein
MPIEVSIANGEWRRNDAPLHPGREWNGIPLQGRLLNSRMVQATFDDRNPETRPRWNYPDGPWDAERNLREFLAAMPEWRAHGLDAITVNYQGGSPQGYSQTQPWENTAFDPQGRLREPEASRMDQVLDAADACGLIVILGLFYFGQDERLEDESAVLRAVDEAVDRVLQAGRRNVVIEIANEIDLSRYEHDILSVRRAPELIARVKDRSGGKLLVSTSTSGGAVPPDDLIAAVDFVLLHGNGVHDAAGLATMVEKVRQNSGYRGQPIDFNEDDHFEFGSPDGHFATALRAGAGWGYFDYRMAGEGFDEGYQSVPVNWGISSERKRGFFRLVREMTGGVF